MLKGFCTIKLGIPLDLTCVTIRNARYPKVLRQFWQFASSSPKSDEFMQAYPNYPPRFEESSAPELIEFPDNIGEDKRFSVYPFELSESSPKSVRERDLLSYTTVKRVNSAMSAVSSSSSDIIIVEKDSNFEDGELPPTPPRGAGIQSAETSNATGNSKPKQKSKPKKSKSSGNLRRDETPKAVQNFFKVWSQNEKKFVQFQPPAIFCDYREATVMRSASSGLRNVFAEIAGPRNMIVRNEKKPEIVDLESEEKSPPVETGSTSEPYRNCPSFKRPKDPPKTQSQTPAHHVSSIQNLKVTVANDLNWKSVSESVKSREESPDVIFLNDDMDESQEESQEECIVIDPTVTTEVTTVDPLTSAWNEPYDPGCLFNEEPIFLPPGNLFRPPPPPQPLLNAGPNQVQYNNAPSVSTSDSVTANFASSTGIGRSWEPSNPPSGTRNPADVNSSIDEEPMETNNGTRASLQFTLCSYNVLCQSTIRDTQYLYGHCRNTRDLDWNNRWKNLSREFRMLNADIFCLQEVQADHYEQHYKEFFTILGYEGLFKKRTGNKADGCAVFWRKSKFSLSDFLPVEFAVPGTHLDRDNIGIVLSLMPVGAKSKKRRLVLATTHILFNPKRGDLKLAQLALLFAAIDKMAFLPPTPKKLRRYHPILLCGDFNLEPVSPLYNFIVNGQLHYEGELLTTLSSQGKMGGRAMGKNLLPEVTGVSDSCQLIREVIKRSSHPRNHSGAALQIDYDFETNSGSVRHGLNLLSVYRHVTKKDEFEVTTHHKDTGNVDYIFYHVSSKESTVRDGNLIVRNIREGRLRCLERYSLLGLSELNATVGRLPNRYCGSDHVPLMAKFELLL